MRPSGVIAMPRGEAAYPVGPVTSNVLITTMFASRDSGVVWPPASAQRPTSVKKRWSASVPDVSFVTATTAATSTSVGVSRHCHRIAYPLVNARLVGHPMLVALAVEQVRGERGGGP